MERSEEEGEANTRLVEKKVDYQKITITASENIHLFTLTEMSYRAYIVLQQN